MPTYTGMDTANVTGGVAFLKLAAANLAHTQGGISVSVTPATRNRNVDVYGTTPIQVLHTGDDMQVTAAIAEWSKAVLEDIYEPGITVAASGGADGGHGIGRSAGYVYTPAELDVVPVDTTTAHKKIKIFRAVPTGQFEINHDNDNDRIFNVTFIAIVDETKADGQFLGVLYHTKAAGGG